MPGIKKTLVLLYQFGVVYSTVHCESVKQPFK